MNHLPILERIKVSHRIHLALVSHLEAAHGTTPTDAWDRLAKVVAVHWFDRPLVLS